MKAGVYTEAGTLELQDWPEPTAGPGELLVRVRGCGLCGSDILKVTSPGTKAPAVFGHEVVGADVEKVWHAGSFPTTAMLRNTGTTIRPAP